MTRTRDEEELALTERMRLKALVDADVPLADQLHAAEFELVTPGGATYTKEQYLGAIASGEVDYLVWEPFDIDVRVVSQNAGCLRYHSNLDIVVGGHRVGPRRYWHTDYYERRDGRWQVIWSQATEIAASEQRT